MRLKKDYYNPNKEEIFNTLDVLNEVKAELQAEVINIVQRKDEADQFVFESMTGVHLSDQAVHG